MLEPRFSSTNQTRMLTTLPESCTANPKIWQRFETLRKVEAAEQRAEMDEWRALSNGQLFPSPDEIPRHVCEYYLNLCENNERLSSQGIPTVNLVESEFKKLRPTKRKFLLRKIMNMKSLREGKPVNSLNLGVSEEQAQLIFDSKKKVLDQIEHENMFTDVVSEIADTWACYSPFKAIRVDSLSSEDKVDNKMKSCCSEKICGGGCKSQRNLIKKMEGDVKSPVQRVSTPKAGSLCKKSRFTHPGKNQVLSKFA
jgi:hypothetical protein